MEKKRVVKLRQAKATQDEVKNLCEFLNMIDEVLHLRTYTSEDEETEKIPTNDRFVELIEQFWCGDLTSITRGINNSWRRIVFGYVTLLDNACDPNSEFLEWREDIAEFLENKNEETSSSSNVFKV